MLNERIDSINENKTIFLLENNEHLVYNENLLENLNKINNNLSFEEDKDTLKNPTISNYYYINKKEEENININEGNSIELRAKENKNVYIKDYKRYDFLHKIVENNEGNAPILYSFDKILNIFEKEENKNKFKAIVNIYCNKEGIKEDNLIIEEKRKKAFINEESNNINELIEKEKQNNKTKDNKNNSKNTKIKINIDKKRGRKTNEIKDVGVHNKMVPDNIIKKIKPKIFEYPIIFLNNIINNQKTEENYLN